MRKWLRMLVRDEQGVTTLEYALVLALIVAAGVVAWQTFGETVNESGVGSTDSINDVNHDWYAAQTPSSNPPTAP